MKNCFLFVLAVAALSACSGIAAAQDADPPSRVARIAYLNGQVSFEPASVDQWADASLNYPMTTGDNLYANAGGRAVLRIGQNSIRLNSGTNFQFLNLSDNIVQTSINAGNMSISLHHLYDGESWEVDTPNGAITLLRTGKYRIDTDSSRNATMVTVRSGDIEVTANNQSFPVHSGQTAYFDNTGDPPDVQAVNQPDDFDSFASSRDRLEDAPPPQYVSPDMVGYEDLSANGDWRNMPGYGAVWTPRVAAGWTPYHDGYWAWVEPWGWTWVAAESWGFAPFHYGRWAFVDNSWGWCPGPVAERVYYAPALVAFVGGAGFSAGVSIGGGGLIGWFPLGPREVYYPSYHVSERYIREVNVTNTRITNINVTNIHVTNINYVNRNGMVAMLERSFVSAQPVRHDAVRIDSNQMRQAEVIGAAPKVAPQRESFFANSTGRRAAAPPAAFANRAVIAKLAPPPAAVPFAARQQLLQRQPGTPVAPAQLQTLRVQTARQNQPPMRVQVQPINTQTVRPVTPAIRPGPAPAFAQRPAREAVPVARPQGLSPVREQVQHQVGQTPLVERVEPQGRPAPSTPEPAQPQVRREQLAPERAQPPIREALPIERPQPQVRREQLAPERAQPPVREALPIERPQPQVRREQPAPERAQPPVREALPIERPQPQVRREQPAPERTLPPVREAPPIERPQPQVRQAPPPPQEYVQPPVREAAPEPVREQRAEHPARQQPPPAQAQPQRQPPPPKKEEKKPEEKKPEEKKQ